MASPNNDNNNNNNLQFSENNKSRIWVNKRTDLTKICPATSALKLCKHFPSSAYYASSDASVIMKPDYVLSENNIQWWKLTTFQTAQLTRWVLLLLSEQIRY